MTWCNDCSDVQTIERSTASMPPPPPPPKILVAPAADQRSHKAALFKSCPSCGHQIKCHEAAIHDLPGLPAGVKFDPTDQELLEHLEGKVRGDVRKLHPLIDEFIGTIDGENGICYTHPEKLPGVSKDGLVRHFFHRPSKAYTTGTRKRRKVHTDSEGGETRWHKTGKTRPVFVGGRVKGHKKILVLYTNYGKQKKPEKTNWVMHQYHLGHNEEEKEGEIVVSKVFYQTQPRQCGHGSGSNNSGSNFMAKESFLSSRLMMKGHSEGSISQHSNLKNGGGGHANALVDYYASHANAPSFISFEQGVQNRPSSTQMLAPFTVHDGAPFIP